MSTGSSDESSGSSGLPEEAASPASEAVFSWPNYAVNHSNSPSPSQGTEEHRSVSQIGEPPESLASEASSGAYVKMNRRGSSEATYMNVIYSAVQRQGGGGSVEDAISPYLDMKQPNVKNLANANVDAISSIYARPQSVSSMSVTPVKKSSTKKSSK